MSWRLIMGSTNQRGLATEPSYGGVQTVYLQLLGSQLAVSGSNDPVSVSSHASKLLFGCFQLLLHPQQCGLQGAREVGQCHTQRDALSSKVVFTIQ